jgi:hypothetical protein
MAGIKGRTGIHSKERAGRKGRTPLVISQDRKQMFRLWKSGWSKTAIAKHFGLHRTQVVYDLRRVV